MKHTFLTTLAISSIAVLAHSGSASAAVVLATGIEAFHQGDSAPGGDGSNTRAIDGSGLTKPDANNPATWTHNNAWQADWQGQNVNFANPSANYAVINLGSPTANLDQMYLWNVNEGTATSRGMQNFEIFYATTPTLLPSATSATNQTYSFGSGGWTQLGSTPFTLSQGTGVNGLLPDAFNVSGASGAQYIGFRILSRHGNDATNRVGFGEVAFTTIPEPAGFALLLVGGVAGIFRRRR